MNPEILAAMRQQIECRRALNNLPEDASEESRQDAIRALDAADVRLATLLESVPDPQPAPAELRDRISLGRYMHAIAEDRQADGAEGELRQELGLSNQAIPVEALLPTPEERADVASPQDADGDPLPAGTINVNTGPMLGRVFSLTDTAFLRVGMPVVPAGLRRYPVMVDGTTASMQARGSGPDAQPAKFNVVDSTPKRLTGRYVLDIEGVAEMGGLLESTLRSDLRREMGYQMDRQILLGTGKTNQVTGLIHALDLTLNPGESFATNNPSKVIDWALAKQLGYGSLDGQYIRSESDIRLLIGKATYDLLRAVYRSDEDPRDGIDAAMTGGTRVRPSYQLPAPAVETISPKTAVSTKNVQRAILCAEPMSAVAPVWQGITMIRDPYSNARGGQVVFTAHMLFDFVLRRKNGWRQYAIRTEA